MSTSTPDPTSDPEIQRLAGIAAFVRARRQVAEAQERLRELGVRITFGACRAPGHRSACPSAEEAGNGS